MSQYRHEWKHEISLSDRLALRARLGAVCRRDSHTVDGRYQIRSLYFDTPADKALREKIDGVNRREKFRIRYYNGDASLLHLEKKSKLNGLSAKEVTELSAAEAQAIVDGRLDWMPGSGRPLVQELYHKMRTQGLRPRTIVDYTREPFVYPPGNVRVTLDYHIRTGLGCTDLLNPDCVTIPAGESVTILEVKWDAFLPGVIRDAVQLPNRRAGAFSKYAQCRIYGV
ncbi:MAG: polyphosphate polymerase domain-containing protein [Oscillospiraceae bacterium]|nr:polyphosphate polymerase domain-containing protein [Oscillospiraceae bacterium]